VTMAGQHPSYRNRFQKLARPGLWTTPTGAFV